MSTLNTRNKMQDQMEDECAYCKKPRSQWTSRLRWRSVKGEIYCSSKCYFSANYDTQLQLSRILAGIVWVFGGILIILLISDMNEFTTAVAIWIFLLLFFFSASLFYPLHTAKKRSSTPLVEFFVHLESLVHS